MWCQVSVDTGRGNARMSSQWSHRWLYLALAILLPPQETEAGCLQAATGPAEQTMAVAEKWLPSLTEPLVRRLHLQTHLDSLVSAGFEDSPVWSDLVFVYLISFSSYIFLLIFVTTAVVNGDTPTNITCSAYLQCKDWCRLWKEEVEIFVQRTRFARIYLSGEHSIIPQNTERVALQCQIHLRSFNNRISSSSVDVLCVFSLMCLILLLRQWAVRRCMFGIFMGAGALQILNILVFFLKQAQ